MYKLHIMPGHITVHAEPGRNLMPVLQEHGVFLDAPCGGNGTCGNAGY